MVKIGSSCVTIYLQTDFVVMSMVGDEDEDTREMRMDSTLPAVDADGKVITDNNTNRNPPDSSYNVIERPNGNNHHSQPRPSRLSQLSPTASSFVAGSSIHLQQPPLFLQTSTARPSIDDTPVSPTTVRIREEPRGRPLVRLPGRTSARGQTVTEMTGDDQFDPAVAESLTVLTTSAREQPPPGTTSDQGSTAEDDAANALLMLGNASPTTYGQELVQNLQEQGVSNRDFAMAPVPVNRSSLSPPPNEPVLDSHAPSTPSTDSGMGMLHIPQPAQFLLPSDPFSMAPSPARQPLDEDVPPWIRWRRGQRRSFPEDHDIYREAPTPRPQMTWQERRNARHMRMEDFRDSSVFIAQAMRIVFARSSSPGTRGIQRQFHTMRQARNREDRERRASFESPVRRVSYATRLQEIDDWKTCSQWLGHRDLARRRRQAARLERERVANDMRQQAQAEKAANTMLANKLRRRLSIQFGEIDLPTDTPSRLEEHNELSSMPWTPRTPGTPRGRLNPTAQIFRPRDIMDGVRTPATRRRSESSSGVVVPDPEVFGRTPVPVIANGRTPEQRRRNPLPDVNSWQPALNGNPAGAQPRSPLEGEAGPSPRWQPRNREHHSVAPPTSKSNTNTASQDCRESAPALSHSSGKGKARLVEDAQPTFHTEDRSKHIPSRSPAECEAGSSSREQQQARHDTSTGPAQPWHPFHGVTRLVRRGLPPLRIVTPTAAHVPGETIPATPPPATAERARRADEHRRLIDHSLSDGEGSDRVIASSSSQTSEEHDTVDADDEDSRG